MPATGFTLNSFVNNLADLAVVGLKRSYDGMPANVEAADLPAMFPRAVSGSGGPLTVKFYGGWPSYSVDLVILVEKAGLNTTVANHQAVVDLIDDFQTAIQVAVNTADYGPKPLQWTWALSSDEVVGDKPYWAVVITISQVGAGE